MKDNVMNTCFIKYIRLFFIILLTSLFTEFVTAKNLADSTLLSIDEQNKKTESIKLHSFSVSPKIDGNLQDSVWHNAAVLNNFVQTFPGDNISPSFSTEVLLGYDNTALYIGISARDETGSIRATLAKRDDVLNDDHIKIYLDTFNDYRRAYLLIFNPLGIQQDGIFVEGVEPDYNVDIVMESRGIITTDGYSIEIAIPFSSLRYQSSEGQEWGIHVIRKIKHLNDEENSWIPLVRGNVGLLNQAGKITGLTDIGDNRNLEIIPSFTLSETGQRKNYNGSENFITGPFHGDPSISMKLNSSSNLSFDLTLNPDFAQIEADQFVVTANQRFPIFFAEKRPFFLEGIEIFNTPLKTVHTRTIIEPDAALKMSGKSGGYSFGLIAASDDAPGNFSKEELADTTLRSSIDKFIGKNAYISVARLKKDIGAESYIGLLTTSYNFIEKENYTFGFDGRFNFTPNTALSLQLSGTVSNSKFYEPDINSNVYRKGYGFGYYISFLQSSRHFNLTFEGQGRTPDYRAFVGFTTQTNINRWAVITRYNSEPKPDALLISWSAVCTFLSDFDWQGRLKYSYVYPRVLLNFPKQSFLNFYFYTDYLRLLEEEFGPKRNSAQAGAFFGEPERSTVYKGFTIETGTTPVKEITARFILDRSWDNFDYDLGVGTKFPRVSPAALENPNAPLDPGKGNTTDIQTSLIYQPSEALRFSFEYIKSCLFREDTKRVAFDQNIYLIGSTYQFTRFSFARLRLEYESMEAKVRAQLLLGWTPNPGTSIYIGYNEDLNYDGYNPFTKKYESGFHRNSRIFFLKLSYVFQFGF
ncbi:MAG: carbohydrate binding family 9 domain-containing protein [Bacteroidetes bacterium]|nr:carbohydrate binding family 9 domain-containing protein [Bacteroidota bacterium]